ncbi:GAF domain-containing protein [Actinoplanes sp. NPDC020271]|uniref:GAF domain-containing protein n=1 Tax=Actinoplanes sp. NPDC020271 TaxID=3363896 RepID=UPI003798F9E7
MQLLSYESCSLDVLHDTRSETVAALYAASIGIRDDLAQVMRIAAAQAGADAAAISLRHDHVVVMAAAHGVPDRLSRGAAVPAAWSPCSRITTSDRPLLIGDLQQERFGFFPGSAVLGTLRSYAGVPLRHAGHVVGAVCVVANDPHVFSTATLASLSQAGAKVLRMMIGYAEPTTPSGVLSARSASSE